MTLIWTVFIIYCIVAVLVAAVNFIDWAGVKSYYPDEARDAAKRAVRAHVWPLMLVDKIKEMKEDAK